MMRCNDALQLSRNLVRTWLEAAAARVASPYRQSTAAQLRLLMALVALLAMLVSVRSVMGASAAGSSRPTFVAIAIHDPLQQLGPDSDGRAALIRETMQRISAIDATQPEALIALRLDGAHLRFDRLTSTQRQALVRAHGNDAQAWYEQALAGFFDAILDEVGRSRSRVQLSVYGLPIEGKAQADRINQRYAGAIGRLDALVSSKHVLADADGTLMRHLPAALSMRHERPVYYRVNSQWQSYPPAAASKEAPGHSAQDDVLRDALAVLEQNPELASMLRRRGLHPDDIGRSGSTADQMDLLALLADWNQSESPWDLNHDGTVNVFDLLELLQRWADQSSDDGIARFESIDSEYVIGSGAVIRVQLLADAPVGADVVFQTWSDVSNSIESPYHDTQAPFEYPSGALDHVTPGAAEIQALVRDADDRVVLRLTAAVEVVSASGSDDPPADGDPPSGGGPGGPDVPTPGGDDDDDQPGTPPLPDGEWSTLFDELDEDLLVHLQPIELPAQPNLNNPTHFTIRSPGDIPHPIPSNAVLTVEGEIALSDANNGFIFNNGTSDVLVRFEPGAQLRYTGGFSDRGLFQFHTTAQRIRIENAVIVGRTGTQNTCHAFATRFGSGTSSDITIVGGDVSGVRFTFQGEGGCERLLITGMHAHDNWEYFVWGSNNMVHATFCHNIVDGVEAQHGIRLAPGVDGVNIVGNDIRVGQQGLIKRSIWIPGANNVSILANHTRDGRVTIGPNPAFNEPGPTGVILAGNRIDHDRNNLSIELFSGARDVLVTGNTVTTPHADWMQCGTTDQFNRPFEDIRWTEDNVANNVERHGFDGIRVSSAFVGRPDIGPID